MSGGTYPNIDCEKCSHNSKFKAETETNKTVGSTDCKIDDQNPPAEQIVEFDADSNNNNAVYAHAKAESQDGEISIQSDEWIDNIYLPAGATDSDEFEIQQASSSPSTNPDTFIIDIYYSQQEIDTDDPDDDIPDTGTHWGKLEPEITLS
jgi:hypothetical protein